MITVRLDDWRCCWVRHSQATHSIYACNRTSSARTAALYKVRPIIPNRCIGDCTVGDRYASPRRTAYVQCLSASRSILDANRKPARRVDEIPRSCERNTARDLDVEGTRFLRRHRVIRVCAEDQVAIVHAWEPSAAYVAGEIDLRRWNLRISQPRAEHEHGKNEGLENSHINWLPLGKNMIQ